MMYLQTHSYIENFMIVQMRYVFQRSDAFSTPRRTKRWGEIPGQERHLGRTTTIFITILYHEKGLRGGDS